VTSSQITVNFHNMMSVQADQIRPFTMLAMGTYPCIDDTYSSGDITSIYADGNGEIKWGFKGLNAMLSSAMVSFCIYGMRCPKVFLLVLHSWQNGLILRRAIFGIVSHIF